MTLTWLPSANPDVAGFKIYYGTASHTYTNSLVVGLVTNLTVNGLTPGETYYFAATTYDAQANKSDFSNEATYAIPASEAPPTATNSVATNPPPVIDPPSVVITNEPPVVTNPPPITTNSPVSLNQTPTLNWLANLTINQNVAGQTIGLSGITAGSTTENQLLKVTVTSSNPGLVNPAINYTSPRTTGTLTFTPAANRTGSALIIVTINDGGVSNNILTRTFVVTVLATSTNPVTIKTNLKRPSFKRSLTNSIILAGKTVSLNASVTGQGPFKYQWKFNGQTIPSATGTTLSLKNVKATQSGTYTLSVANSLGSTNTSAALTVLASPAATLSTATRTAEGTFSFQVSGVPGYKYVIQTTSDLTHWNSVQTNTAPFTFVDNTPDASQRFYRSYYDSAL